MSKKTQSNFDPDLEARLAQAAKPRTPGGTAARSTMRTFLLVRDLDVSGTSGTGPVAEGVEWSNGTITMHWLSQLETHENLANMKVLMQIHGHGGATRVEFTS